MSLGDHLGSHQDIHLTTSNLVQYPGMTSLATGGITVHPCNPGFRKLFQQFMLNPFRPHSHLFQLQFATGRADAGGWNLIVAVVTEAFSALAMVGQGNRAVGTLQISPAGRTDQPAGKTAPVQEQQALFASLKVVCQGLEQLGRER